MVINVNTFMDFFTLPLKLLVSSGDLPRTKMKMKYRNVRLSNEVTNHVIKEANKEWLIYEAGLLNRVLFYFYWICHIHQRHYLQDYWTLSMVTDTKKLISDEWHKFKTKLKICRLVGSWFWHSWYLIAVLEHFLPKPRLWHLNRVSLTHISFLGEFLNFADYACAPVS